MLQTQPNQPQPEVSLSTVQSGELTQLLELTAGPDKTEVAITLGAYSPGFDLVVKLNLSNEAIQPELATARRWRMRREKLAQEYYF